MTPATKGSCSTEITKKAITEAFKQPSQLDQNG